jgi:hypothetical protein
LFGDDGAVGLALAVGSQDVGASARGVQSIGTRVWAVLSCDA